MVPRVMKAILVILVLKPVLTCGKLHCKYRSKYVSYKMGYPHAVYMHVHSSLLEGVCGTVDSNF